MSFLFFLSSVVAVVFGLRWFKEHSFEYLDGVKFSDQLDTNFWLCMVFVAIGLFFGTAAFS